MTDRPKTRRSIRFSSKAGRWREEMQKLRAIVRDRRLSEAIKWGWPCYAFERRNVVLIHGFKHYCALLFFKGALMKDPAGVLHPADGKRAGRAADELAGLADVARLEPVIRAYVDEAIALEKAGAKVPLKPTKAFAIPEAFAARLDRDPDLKAAFAALTPGRQRAYLLHFSSAKQAKTRELRIETCAPRILEGKGLDD